MDQSCWAVLSQERREGSRALSGLGGFGAAVLRHGLGP